MCLFGLLLLVLMLLPEMNFSLDYCRNSRTQGSDFTIDTVANVSLVNRIFRNFALLLLICLFIFNHGHGKVFSIQALPVLTMNKQIGRNCVKYSMSIITVRADRYFSWKPDWQLPVWQQQVCQCGQTGHFLKIRLRCKQQQNNYTM